MSAPMSNFFHQNIRFVLVEPSHPGNIGAVARAIKTMGFSQLVLVNPRRFPDPEATARASGADDVLEKCMVVNSLQEAISDCEHVIGTSVRDRQISWPVATPKETAIKIQGFLKSGSENSPEKAMKNNQLQSDDFPNIAVLFGRERTGLENHELDHAQWQIRIPANDEYNSLNLASAVQIIAYELNCALIDIDMLNQEEVEADKTKLEKRQRLATHGEMQGFYQHLEETLLELDFIKTNPPTKLLRKIIRLYNRNNVSFEELQILRGILSATQQKIKH